MSSNSTFQSAQHKRGRFNRALASDSFSAPSVSQPQLAISQDRSFRVEQDFAATARGAAIIGLIKLHGGAIEPSPSPSTPIIVDLPESHPPNVILSLTASQGVEATSLVDLVSKYAKNVPSKAGSGAGVIRSEWVLECAKEGKLRGG